MIRSLILLIMLTIVGTPYSTHAAPVDIDPGVSHLLDLWDSQAGESKYVVQEDQGDGVIRISNVESPTLAVYLAPASEIPTAAVLICPGGGYSKLAYNKEGTEIATWLNGHGISAAVLKYRVPGNRDGALEDAQRAMGLIRQHEGEWNIDPKRVGILGFSAGGHLAARTSTTSLRAYEPTDEADSLRCTPDFTILIYPAYIGDGDYKVASEIAVDSDTPRAFIVQTQDDKHYIDSSIAYYMALKEAGVASELHLYPTGGHGYGMRPSTDGVSGWPELCSRWLKTIGIVK